MKPYWPLGRINKVKECRTDEAVNFYLSHGAQLLHAEYGQFVVGWYLEELDNGQQNNCDC